MDDFSAFRTPKSTSELRMDVALRSDPEEEDIFVKNLEMVHECNKLALEVSRLEQQVEYWRSRAYGLAKQLNAETALD